MATKPVENMGERTYADTVARGFYTRNVGGLFGKYDNVRAYWEDDLTLHTLRPHVTKRVEACTEAGRGMRILDLGCGAGQGFELVTAINQSDLDMHDEQTFVLQPEQLELYLGLDFSEAMVEQGQTNYQDVPQMRFETADLREGLGSALKEKAFDLYFSSYGALSHLDAASLRRCLSEAARHARPGALLVLDMLGRYSPEWPGYWGAKTEAEKVRPYSMSYLYPESERDNGSVETFPIRFWTGGEVRSLCAEISAEQRVALDVLELVDRSLFVGRHVDTKQYGTCLPPLRSMVNSLYEHNVRTRLEDLRVNWRSVAGSDELNAFFLRVAECWNVVIDFTIERLNGVRVNLVAKKGWRGFPPALQMALVTLDRIVDSVDWIDVGDTRANIVEPQLAYVLRRMQHSLQGGRGCGHGLVAVIEVGHAAAA